MINFINRYFIKQIIAFIVRHFRLEKSYWINWKYSGKRLEKNIHNTDESKYQKYKDFDEAEHQIGRFLNMKNSQNSKENDIKGDLVEFGTWQGQSLQLLI